MDTYYIKYLKYKNKYLTLQKQIGGIDCANHNFLTCPLIPGCTTTIGAAGCTQTECINKNKIDCKTTRGCNYNDKIKKCVPDCEKFNNEKDYSRKESKKYRDPANKMYCNFVDECKFDGGKCIIRDDNLRKEHLQNS